MSKQEKLDHGGQPFEYKDISNVKFYKKLGFAYGILAILLSLLAGTAFGWVQRSAHETQVKAEATSIVESLAKKAEK